MSNLTTAQKLAIVFVAWLLLSGKGCGVIGFPQKVTAAVYVYEKDQTAIPPAVLAAMDKLNRRGIVANSLDVQTTDGIGDVPDQFKVPFSAAKEAGLPSLVVTAGPKVLKVVKDPKTEEAVLEAAP